MASPAAAPQGPGILTGVARSAKQLPVVRPVLPDLESVETELKEMLANGILTNGGPHTVELEDRLADQLGLPNPVVLGNGTVAIMLALEAMMPVRGEVIVPSFTFAATANATVWAGFEPVFADIDPATMTLDVSAVEDLIGPRTVGILPVHPFGGLCDIEAIERLASEHGLIVVYDSAQAVGVRYKGQSIGNFGAGETFSLHTTKVLPVGEGGVVSCGDPEVADRLWPSISGARRRQYRAWRWN